MATSKNHNSILFLTTLGVYLGLVLVGATPVLGHAATTRNFEIQDEIEFAEDIEKKPTPTDEDIGGAIEAYFEGIGNFIHDLRKLRLIEKFDETFEIFAVNQVTFAPCPETGGLLSRDNDSHIDRWILPAIIEAKFLTERTARYSDCMPFSEISSRDRAQSAGLKLSYDKKELLHELSFNFSSFERSENYLAGLSKAFGHYKPSVGRKSEINRVLYKHTTLTRSNDQVFIVTRLPRAGLDSLLARNAQ